VGIHQNLVMGGMVNSMSLRNIRTAVLGTGVGLAVFTVSCGDNGGRTTTVEAKEQAATTPRAASEPPETMTDEINVSGALLVEHQLDVAALRDGVISSITADVDSLVHKGQVLATLDDRQITADCNAAAERVQELESDLKNWAAEVKVLEADQQRAEQMWAAKLIAQEQLDHIRYNVVADRFQSESARHKLENARATLQSLQLEAEKTRIRAPFDGVVARRYVREAQRVANGDRIFWVTSVAPLLVRFTVPERLAGIAKRGEDIRVSSTERDAPAHIGTITTVSPVIDPSSSTVEVVARLRGPAGDLRAGMTVNIALRNKK